MIKKIINKISKFFDSKLNVEQLELNTFMGLLKAVRSKIEIQNIDRIYNLYSSPIEKENYNQINMELSKLSPLNDQDLKLHDFIAVYFIELVKGEPILLVISYTNDYFSRESYFFKVKEIPSFSIRKLLVYQNRFYYPMIENQNSKPILISDSVLRKYKID